MRLRQWLDLGLGEYQVFAVEDEDNELVAACFTCAIGPVMDVHEIGLIDDGPLRLPAYLEAGLYAPIRYALRNRIQSLELGGEAIEAKRVRGAEFEPVSALAYHT
jgi:predicted N-acyltransferase